MPRRTKFTELKNVFRALHGPKGCLCDKKQTHKSILPQLKEEVDEFILATRENDYQHMQEELGDILLHVMFHSQIASKAGNFEVEHVIEGLISKLKRRHPHVFGKTKVKNTRQIISNWNKIKLQEKRNAKKYKV